MTMVAPAGPEGVKRRASEISAAGTSSLIARAGEQLRERMAWLSPHLSWHRAALGLFVLLGLVVIATFSDYGVTWDEDVHNWYGVFVLDYYLSLFQDGRCLNWLNLYNYGAAFDTIAAALNHFSPFGTYETRHLLNGFLGVLGIAGSWKLARSLGGPRAGFIAALLLLAIPNYYGQMFNNPKDIPFAVGMVWSIYYMVRIIPLLPRPKWSLVAKLGVATGMALGVRVGGLLIFCYLGLLLLCFVLWRGIEAPSPRRILTDGFASLWRVLLPTIAVAYPVMLLFWPWAQESPIANPLRSLIFFSHETFPYRTLFAGHYFSASDLPWAYLPTYIVLALPELVLALALAAPIGALLTIRRLPGAERRDWILRHGLLAFAIVFPVTYAVTIKAVLFDGMRHFIFLLPLIAVAAALVADRVVNWLAQFGYRRPVYAAVALYGIAHFSMMAMLHPNEYVYYNGFVGGVEGAQGLFKLDYWANSYAEAVDGLENYLETQYGLDFMDRDFTVAVCGPPISADYFFPKNFTFSEDREHADFFIAFTKDDCNKSLPGTEIFRVERMGALLSVVLDRRDIVAAEARAKRPPPVTVSSRTQK
jgi:hypothetical protein